ncbi:hypothetical protein BZA05DRAFT_137663 [Tricharina praecox]|uniref:uncharacterized protein n=1 Tax=Tricharina praecox TaxID=43433 RepID=UPI00221F8CEC|nr:uncharacterized protein BZA05DRAFT_137663 [Tricharina praecox]KAI5846058.1 hypothetical protein BZA05DRAFT_137663 [Tricharina praecox]
MYPSPNFPQHSYLSNGLMDAIDLPNNHLRPDNGMYSRSRAHAAHSRSESSLHNSDMYMATDTQDLAEFLRTSSPQDFRKFLKRSPSDDQLFSLGGKSRRGFSFLRPSASKTKLKSPVLPTTVLAKKTSWGKPYLQIQIDYDGAHDQAEPRTTLPDRTSTSGMSDFTADFGFGESLMAPSTIISPPPSTMGDAERPTLSHARWASTTSAKTLDSETVDIYRKYLNSQSCNADFDLHPNRETNHAPAPTEAAGGNNDRLKPTAYQKTPSSEAVPRRRSDSYCYLSSPQNKAPIKVRKRSSSLRRTSRGSSRSSVYSATGDELLDADGNVIHPHRKASKRAPPRPGPPPARGLPALPESRGSIVNATTPRSFVSATATASLRGSSIYNHRLPGEDFDRLQHDGMTREQKVRAKKARDMQQVKLRRQIVVDQESVYTLGSDRTNTPPHEAPQPLPTPSPKNKSAPFKAPVPLENSQSLKGWVARVPTPPNSPPKPPRKSPTPSTAGSKPLPPPPPSTRGSYKTEEEMQLRIEAVERKNRMLEKALIAVIRGTVGNDQRQTELQRANSLEEILRQLRMVDPNSAAGTPTAVVSTKST